MNQVDQNINKDMFDSDLIDVESLDYSDDQTWLYTIPEDSGQHVDIVDWNLSCDWPSNEDGDYIKLEKELYTVLDNILKNEILSLPDKHKFDSRTFIRPKKRTQRPSIHNIMEVASNPPSMSPHPSLNQSSNKYLTYNKYNNPLGQISPMLRLKTFNVDTNTENSSLVKEYAMKRRSLVQDDDPQLEDMDVTLGSGRSSMDHTPSKPINIDLSQPAHNLHNTFNKWITDAYLSAAHAQRSRHSVTSPQNMALTCSRGLTNIMQERGSLNMYQSGESLMRMSPPSLVSSLLMESSGTFNTESIDGRKSLPHKEMGNGYPMMGRESIDPMMTSMTLSILDEKDMSTSFLSQTTYPDNDSLIDSLPPSLVSSVNSSFVISNSATSKAKDTPEPNIFSSATFTNLDQSHRLLSERPRATIYNSFTKREGIRGSESYTKAREEACQIDSTKILNENCDNKESPKSSRLNEMGETITYYSNNRFKKANDAEKENFERDDAFYKEMGVPKPEDLARNSLNVTLGKQELNEIIQARQKLSLARKGLPCEPDKAVPQTETSPIKTIQLPNQTITVPRQSIENASELLSRRRATNTNGCDKQEEPIREPPKRNATFKKLSPKANAMDTTVVYVKTDDNNIIDINSATMNLIDGSERTEQQELKEWGSQERAMVGSNESTDTGTFSSSSPPDSVPDAIPIHHPRAQVASTPLMSIRKGCKNELLDLHNTISPIYDVIDDQTYAMPKTISANATLMERTYDMHNTTIVSSASFVKKASVKRDIMAGKMEKKMLGPSSGLSGCGLPSSGLPSSGLPSSYLANNGLKSPLAHKTISSSTVSYGHMIPPTGVPRKTGLPTSKLRQYSSHKELNRIPSGQPLSGAPAAPRAVTLAGRAMLRRGVYASNPALSPTSSVCPAPVIVTDSYTIATCQKAEDKSSRSSEVIPPPALVRQGTETLRRERPHSQLIAPKDPPALRPSSISSTSQIRGFGRPTSGPAQRLQQPQPIPVVEQPRPSSGDVRVSALPRPSRLPAPRRTLRPPSVYSTAPSTELEHY